MANETSGMIRLVETEYEEVSALEARLHVSVRGTAFFTGDAALTKAREVQALVAGLKQIGIAESAIQLQSVEAEVTSGVLGRTSHANYMLEIQCPSLDLLPDALGVITSQKNAKLSHLTWEYGDLREIEERLIDNCIERANRKAQRIARALGVALLGVATYAEQLADRPPPRFAGTEDLDTAVFFRNRARSSLTQELGLPITHKRRVTAGIEIAYRISEFEHKPGND